MRVRVGFQRGRTLVAEKRAVFDDDGFCVVYCLLFGDWFYFRVGSEPVAVIVVAPASAGAISELCVLVSAQVRLREYGGEAVCIVSVTIILLVTVMEKLQHEHYFEAMSFVVSLLFTLIYFITF